ncbi:hypothetical protein F4778DRAFT_783100 [Xylariomycetidae sp. FL2044]|nr:hypothetical protein F4778DRAFT_783100 [Xylariomycetidae sp. FL2044]
MDKVDENDENDENDDEMDRDWDQLARGLRERDGEEKPEPFGQLGMRPLDLTFDWSPFVGPAEYREYGGDFSCYVRLLVDRARERMPDLRINIINDALPDADQLRDTLNPEQRVIFDMYEHHYGQVLAGDNPPALMVNCDGSAGSGESYVMDVLSLRLGKLAEEIREPDNSQ